MIFIFNPMSILRQYSFCIVLFNNINQNNIIKFNVIKSLVKCHSLFLIGDLNTFKIYKSKPLLETCG
jgi:hypothetical protein